MDIVKSIPDDSQRVAAHNHKACSAREKMLAENYLKYPGDPKRAAREAGYASLSCAALKRPHVAAYLELLQEALAAKSAISAEKVLKETALLAFSNMQDYMEIGEDGMPRLNFVNVSREKWAAITEFTEDSTGGQNDGERRLVIRHRIKLGSKIQALEMLAKHFKLLTEKHEIGFSDEVIAKLNEGRQRVKTLEHVAPAQLESK